MYRICVWVYLYITQHCKSHFLFQKEFSLFDFTLKSEKFRSKFARCCEIRALLSSEKSLPYGSLVFSTISFISRSLSSLFSSSLNFSSLHFTKTKIKFSKNSLLSLRIAINSAISLRKMSTSRWNLYLWSAQLCVNGDFFFLASFYKWM